MSLHALIITGPRDFRGEPSFVWSILDMWLAMAFKPGSTLVLVHGACPHQRGPCSGASVDALAAGWQRIKRPQVGHVPMPAPFHREGRVAGPKRNAKMAAFARSLSWCGYDVQSHVICPSQSQGGTKQCLRELRIKGLEPYIHEPGCQCLAHKEMR